MLSMGSSNPAHKCIKMCWNLKTNVIITGHFCCSESLCVCAWGQSFLLLLFIHDRSHFRRIKTVQKLLSERSHMSNQPLKIYARKTTSYEDETNCSLRKSQTEAPYQILNFCFVEKVSWLWHKPKRIPHFLPELSDIFGWCFPHYLILHPLLLCFLPVLFHIFLPQCVL